MYIFYIYALREKCFRMSPSRKKGLGFDVKLKQKPTPSKGLI